MRRAFISSEAMQTQPQETQDLTPKASFLPRSDFPSVTGIIHTAKCAAEREHFF